MGYLILSHPVYTCMWRHQSMDAKGKFSWKAGSCYATDHYGVRKKNPLSTETMMTSSYISIYLSYFYHTTLHVRNAQQIMTQRIKCRNSSGQMPLVRTLLITYIYQWLSHQIDTLHLQPCSKTKARAHTSDVFYSLKNMHIFCYSATSAIWHT